MGDVVTPIQPPTTEERYQHFRRTAEAFVRSMHLMVGALKRDEKMKEASQLQVWALMPWQAALRDDDTDELWCICENCSHPIKDGSEVACGDGGWLCSQCAPQFKRAE